MFTIAYIMIMISNYISTKVTCYICTFGCVCTIANISSLVLMDAGLQVTFELVDCVDVYVGVVGRLFLAFEVDEFHCNGDEEGLLLVFVLMLV